jgi:hypothetical protein
MTVIQSSLDPAALNSHKLAPPYLYSLVLSLIPFFFGDTIIMRLVGQSTQKAKPVVSVDQVPPCFHRTHYDDTIIQIGPCTLPLIDGACYTALQC